MPVGHTKKSFFFSVILPLLTKVGEVSAGGLNTTDDGRSLHLLLLAALVPTQHDLTEVAKLHGTQGDLAARISTKVMVTSTTTLSSFSIEDATLTRVASVDA